VWLAWNVGCYNRSGGLRHLGEFAVRGAPFTCMRSSAWATGATHLLAPWPACCLHPEREGEGRMPCKHARAVNGSQARASITPAVQADEQSPRLGLLSTACSEDLHTRACLVCERACEVMQARSGLSEARSRLKSAAHKRSIFSCLHRPPLALTTRRHRP